MYVVNNLGNYMNSSIHRTDTRYRNHLPVESCHVFKRAFSTLG